MATAGKILMFPVGNWTSGNNYGFLDIVYFGGSSYIAKTDITNSTVDPATDTTNWQILARGYLADALSGIDGIDTSGLIGTAGATVSSQTLIDKIADMVADKLVLKTAISNQQINDTTKVTGSALTYAMNQDITTLNSNLGLKADKSNLGIIIKASNTTISIPSGAGGTTVNSIPLTEGTYILIQRTSFPVSSVGRRRHLFGTNDSNVILSDNGIVTAMGVTDEVTAISSSTTVQVTGTGSVYSNLVQTSGGDMNSIINVLTAIKLK